MRLQQGSSRKAPRSVAGKALVVFFFFTPLSCAGLPGLARRLVGCAGKFPARSRSLHRHRRSLSRRWNFVKASGLFLSNLFQPQPSRIAHGSRDAQVVLPGFRERQRSSAPRVFGRSVLMPTSSKMTRRSGLLLRMVEVLVDDESRPPGIGEEIWIKGARPAVDIVFHCRRSGRGAPRDDFVNSVSAAWSLLSKQGDGSPPGAGGLGSHEMSS